MRYAIQWIRGIELPARLAVGPRPYGGDLLEGCIAGWKSAGVQTVVSALEDREAERLELEREPDLCMAAGLNYLSFPIRDHDIPESFEEMKFLVEQVGVCLDAGHGVLVHCFAGLGRSVTIAACVMAMRGIPPDNACEWISAARRVAALPERPEQRVWIETFYKRFGRML